METYIGRAVASFSPKTFFVEKPEVIFREATTTCRDCGAYLKTTKSRKKPVATIPMGEFVAKETVLHCPICKTSVRSSELIKLAPERSKFGYDVMVYIGEAMFLESRSDGQIVKQLKSRNIEISDREVAYLGKKFIAYLAIAHHEARDRIKASMVRQGGYILHIDGTCDGDSPHLVTGLDGISKIILDNIKLPSESSKQIIPFLEEIKKNYGEPACLVHDMGSGIQKAVNTVFPGIKDCICHFHFLRDIGKDLMGEDYRLIRTSLKNNRSRSVLRQRAKGLKGKFGEEEKLITELTESLAAGKLPRKYLREMPALVAYVLIHFILDAESESNGYGFPFDRPHLAFCQRMLIVRKTLKEVKDQYFVGENILDQVKTSAPLVHLHKLLEEILNNRHLVAAVNTLERQADVFDKLRVAMRIALPEGREGLNDDGEEDIETVEKNLTEFRTWIDSADFPYEQKCYKGLTDQIDKYWEKLFADPIVVETPDGPSIILPQRTNNILERLFRDVKRAYQRKCGTSKMSRALKAMLADTPLVKNLNNETYVKMILDGHSNLVERFTEIEAKLVRKKLEDAKSENKLVPRVLVKLIRREQLASEIINIFNRPRQETA